MGREPRGRTHDPWFRAGQSVAPARKMMAMESAPQTSPWSSAGRTDPTEATEPAGAPVAEVDEPSGTMLLEQGIRVTTGLVALGIAAVADALRRTLPTPVTSDERALQRADPLAMVTGALLGMTLLVGEGAAEAARRVSRAVGPPASWIAGVPPLGPAVGWVRSTATSLDERWRDARPETEAAAGAFARELIPQVIDAVLDQIDLTWLVAERVDLDELVTRVDVDRIVSRVDLDAVVSKLDLNEIAARIDVDAIVARVDVDEVAERLDVAAVIERLDLAELTRVVMEEIDLPEIIRDSTGSMASETVRGVRIQGIEADASVSRTVDRILRRRPQRDTDAPGEPESLQPTPPTEDPGTRS